MFEVNTKTQCRWARVPQTFAIIPKHVDELPQHYLFESKPELHWGSAIYFVQSDGTLALVEENWDSSD